MTLNNFKPTTDIDFESAAIGMLILKDLNHSKLSKDNLTMVECIKSACIIYAAIKHDPSFKDYDKTKRIIEIEKGNYNYAVTDEAKKLISDRINAYENELKRIEALFYDEYRFKEIIILSASHAFMWYPEILKSNG